MQIVARDIGWLLRIDNHSLVLWIRQMTPLIQRWCQQHHHTTGADSPRYGAKSVHIKTRVGIKNHMTVLSAKPAKAGCSRDHRNMLPVTRLGHDQNIIMGPNHFSRLLTTPDGITGTDQQTTMARLPCS